MGSQSNRFFSFKRGGLTLVALFLGTWLIPPIMHEARRLCPVRPDGVSEAEAVPAFARKYGASCSQCHSAFPTLNAYGRAFKLNGYVRSKGSTEGVLETQDG